MGAAIAGAKKIKPRYTKIAQFLGIDKSVTSVIEKQFMMYHKLYEYLVEEVHSADVGYWKQLLIGNNYNEPTENTDLWCNIFGQNVINIHGIYMSDDGKIMRKEEKHTQYFDLENEIPSCEKDAVYLLEDKTCISKTSIDCDIVKQNTEDKIESESIFCQNKLLEEENDAPRIETSVMDKKIEDLENKNAELDGDFNLDFL